MRGKILVVDDEEDLRFFISDGLTQAGWQVYEAESGEAALALLEKVACDVVLLDLRMVRMDGVTVLRQIKERWPELMVIIMTAYATIESAIEAVRQDAFDYLHKPCSMNDILACAERALAKKETLDHQRRLAEQVESKSLVAETTASAHTIRTGALVIDLGTRKVTLAQQELALTPTEYNILETLAQSLGQPVSLDQLIRQAFGHEPDSFNDQEALRVHISHLRRKLDAGYILTARGGYALVELPII
jgi:DNA-binding response OmpR family regulator